MRVRRFELRLIAIALVVAWAIAAALVLLAYRPGGPFDIVVGITMLVPIAIALAAVRWPPVARGAGAFPLMVALGFGALLVLLPSIGGVANQLQALGSQTLLPSWEAAYPWLLALIGTSLFTGFGLSRLLDGGTALRRRRLVAGAGVAAVLTVAAGSLFGGVAIANELAVRAEPATASRFGPTDLERAPMPCDGPLQAAREARLDAKLTGSVDLRPIGTVDISGIRSGDDVRWVAYVATVRELGQYGAARSGERTWSRNPTTGWRQTDGDGHDRATIDRHAVETALTADYRATAEDHGIEVIEGAPARHCRIAIDGATFRDAFPQVGWLVGDADLERWRGQVDYWIFLDGQVGQLAATANGDATEIRPEALQATVDVLLTATERDRDLVVYPPAP